MAPDAVKLAGDCAQTVVEGGVMAITGRELVITATVTDLTQPFKSVPVSEYTVLLTGVKLIAAVVAVFTPFQV